MAIKKDLTTKEAIALVANLKQVIQVFVNLHRMRDNQDPKSPGHGERMREYQDRITVMTWNLRDEMRLLGGIIDGEKESKENDGARAKVRPTEQEESSDT